MGKVMWQIALLEDEQECTNLICHITENFLIRGGTEK